MILERILKWQEAERIDARFLKISTSAYHLLCLVAAEDGHKLSDYAHRMGLTTAAVTGLCDSLEKRGYAKRIRKSTDRRAWIMILTDRGAEDLEKLHTPRT
jgi:DNA-binding MarR family transcriptional regulator